MGEGDFPFLDPVFPPPGTSFSQFYTGLLGLEERRVEGARVRSRVRGWGGVVKTKGERPGEQREEEGPCLQSPGCCWCPAGALSELTP